MVILAEEEGGMWGRLGVWVEDHSSKMPKNGKGLKKHLIDLLTLIFGDESVDLNSIEVFDTSVSVRVNLTIRVSPNGMRQVASGVDLNQPLQRRVTLIYYEDIGEHHFSCSDVSVAYGS